MARSNPRAIGDVPAMQPSGRMATRRARGAGHPSPHPRSVGANTPRVPPGGLGLSASTIFPSQRLGPLKDLTPTARVLMEALVRALVTELRAEGVV